MYQFLEKKRKEVAWDQMECLILVLMSHGVGSRITGSDNKDVEINQLLDIFSSQNCLGLDNKPRLVFVQACRGPLRTDLYILLYIMSIFDSEHVTMVLENVFSSNI